MEKNNPKNYLARIAWQKRKQYQNFEDGSDSSSQIANRMDKIRLQVLQDFENNPTTYVKDVKTKFQTSPVPSLSTCVRIVENMLARGFFSFTIVPDPTSSTNWNVSFLIELGTIDQTELLETLLIHLSNQVWIESGILPSGEAFFKYRILSLKVVSEVIIPFFLFVIHDLKYVPYSENEKTFLLFKKAVDLAIEGITTKKKMRQFLELHDELCLQNGTISKWSETDVFEGKNNVCKAFHEE